MRPFQPLLVVALLAVLGASPAAPQEPIQIVLYLGGLFPSDHAWRSYWGEDIRPQFIAGTRLGIPLVSRSLELEGVYGYAPLRAHERRPAFVCFVPPCDAPLIDVFRSLSTHLYYGALKYSFVLSGRVRPSLLIGYGGLTQDQDEDRPSVSDPIVVLGVGAAVRLDERRQLQLDLRDNVQLCDRARYPMGFYDVGSACPLADATLHHLEFSTGLRFELTTPIFGRR